MTVFLDIGKRIGYLLFKRVSDLKRRISINFYKLRLHINKKALG